MEDETADDTGFLRRIIGINLGVVLFLYLAFGPAIPDLSSEQQRTLAVMALMAVWWVTNAFHMSITALLPLALFPLLSVAPMEEVSHHYASSTIFLFMGGFMMAEGLKRWGLHRRTALTLISWLGNSPRRTLTGFMFTSFFLSMWISNTATAVMIIPMALGVVTEIRRQVGKEQGDTFASALTLGIAYSASVGGIATLIGTPPNLILAGQLPKLLPDLAPLEFGQWLLFGLPTAFGFFLFLWGYLTFFVYREKSGTAPAIGGVDELLAEQGPTTRPEKLLAGLITCTALAWLTRSNLHFGNVTLYGWQHRLDLPHVNDGTVAICFALLMCFTPVSLRKPSFLLGWREIQNIPWSIILLFGGGFALANTIQASGLTTWIGQLMGHLQPLPTWLLVLTLCLGTSFLTEVTSNTATASILLPVLAAASPVLDVHPLLLMIPVTLSASMAFMLPVATPPNAIAFASGELTVPMMARAGLLLNITGALWITLMMYLLGGPLFEIGT